MGNNKTGDLEFCEHCIHGKASRVKFNHAIHRTKETLDYVHSYLWGLALVISHSGNMYFLTIIDDCSRRVWPYLLKHKNEALDRFKTWKNLIENQTSKRVKCLRTNNGLDYCNEKFDDYCKIHGIVQHKIVRKTHQQNGLVERMNRTLLERLRCTLSNAQLPKGFELKLFI